MVGHDDRNAAHDQRTVKRFQRGNSLAGSCTEHDAVGPVKVFDGTAFGEEDRVGNDNHLPSGSLEMVFNALRGTHWDGSHQHQNLPMVAKLRNLQGDLFDALG